MSQLAAALYIQPPMFATTVANQSKANTRWRKGRRADAPSAPWMRSLAATVMHVLLCRRSPSIVFGGLSSHA